MEANDNITFVQHPSPTPNGIILNRQKKCKIIILNTQKHFMTSTENRQKGQTTMKSLSIV